MARRTTIALARPRPLAVSLPAPTRRLAAWSAALVAGVLLAYAGARLSPLFAVEELDVRGAPAGVRGEARFAAAWTLGESLVGLDGDELVRRLEALPSIRSASYDRAFPHSLRVTIVSERPLARVFRSGGAWLVSERGRVIRRLTEKGGPYPRFRLAGAGPLTPGQTLSDPAALLALEALARLPADFPARVRAVKVGGGRAILVLPNRAELRLGEPLDLALKLAVAARVLDSLTHDEWASLAYVDVSLPDRPVAGSNPQVEG